MDTKGLEYLAKKMDEEAFALRNILTFAMVLQSFASLNYLVMRMNYYYILLVPIALGIPNIGIGRATIIKRAIIDQNARIGSNCRIGIDNIKRAEGDFEMYSVHDGIIVINKNAIIPDGTVI